MLPMDYGDGTISPANRAAGIAAWKIVRQLDLW